MSIIFWPLTVVAFGFLIAAIVMLCIPERPRPPQVVVQPIPMWWDGGDGGTTLVSH